MVFSKFSLLFALLLLPAQAFADKKPYVIYLGVHSYVSEVGSENLSPEDSHRELLASILGSTDKANGAIIHSYTKEINGFAAHLEEDQVQAVEGHPDVVSVMLSRGRHIQTTQSWDFMMLEKANVVQPNSLWEKANYGEDIIIANIDSGVWPESKSFSDEGFGPIPSRWKGSCQNGSDVRCNRKLIGAKYFNKGYLASGGDGSLNYTSRDFDGHGTHTLSTAAGNKVLIPLDRDGNGGYSFAKGGSPKARVASYKSCWDVIDDFHGPCSDIDIMEAFDSAIHDGVDVLSVSISANPPNYTYFTDVQAIGAFHAVKKGIPVVTVAGNEGPAPGTVSNVAPWFITVGASTMDRKFASYLEIRDGPRFKGESMYSELGDPSTYYPVIAGDSAIFANASRTDGQFCREAALDPEKVNGKILMCQREGVSTRTALEKATTGQKLGAVAVVLWNDPDSSNEVRAFFTDLPSINLSLEDGVQLLTHHLNTSKDLQARLTPMLVELGTKPAPSVASFSARGPNTITPEILKPDIIAPGVNIIAATTDELSTFGFISNTGTSMACPHVSGVVGLVKKLHPDWSPSAIKSALMTTARTRDNTGHAMTDRFVDQATPFEYGAGHLTPTRAADPGLVYDLTVTDYLDFLCGIGYNQSTIKKVSDEDYDCPKDVNLLNFNYPSISIPRLTGPVKVARKLKNVGSPGTYVARINEPNEISVSVEPKTLKFDKIGEEKTFELTFKTAHRGRRTPNHKFGSLIWSDGRHHVRSPIVVGTGAEKSD